MLITGGLGGLGGLIAEVYGMRGVAVAVCDIKDLNKEEEEELEGKGIRYWRCDVGDAGAVEGMMGEVVKEVGSFLLCLETAHRLDIQCNHSSKPHKPMERSVLISFSVPARRTHNPHTHRRPHHPGAPLLHQINTHTPSNNSPLRHQHSLPLPPNHAHPPTPPPLPHRRPHSNHLLHPRAHRLRRPLRLLRLESRADRSSPLPNRRTGHPRPKPCTRYTPSYGENNTSHARPAEHTALQFRDAAV